MKKRDMRQLFVSHASVDRRAVERIVAYLEARGVKCWIAPRDIPPQSVYADAIGSAMKSARGCLVALTVNANASEAVKRELELASKYKKPFIPVKLERVEPALGLDYYLSNAQWLDYAADRDRALDRLIERVNGALPGPVFESGWIEKAPRDWSLAEQPFGLLGIIGVILDPIAGAIGDALSTDFVVRADQGDVLKVHSNVDELVRDAKLPIRVRFRRQDGKAVEVQKS